MEISIVENFEKGFLLKKNRFLFQGRGVRDNFFETETFGCGYQKSGLRLRLLVVSYQESRLRLRPFTMVSKIETETKTLYFGLKS